MKNLVELLKDCPKGMELDCMINDNVKFIKISQSSEYPIILRTKNGYEITLTKYGQVHNMDDSECVIFPKGKTTWEWFQRPFKDGDIAISSFGNIHILKNHNTSYIHVDFTHSSKGLFCKTLTNYVNVIRLATEEEKQKLFDAIKENGYHWNSKTKTLEKLPKFKVGDRVKHISAYTLGIVVKVSDKGYHIDYPKGEGVCYISFTLEKDYVLVPKFDITTLKPFDKVLVRDSDEDMWCASMYSHTWKDKYFCIGSWYNQCIPYEANKELLGTTNDCDDFYKTWEK